MSQSAEVMLRNSGLADIPDSEEAVRALNSIARVAASGEGPLLPDEFLAIAGLYVVTRDEMERLFEAQPLDVQDEGRAAVGRPRAPLEE